MERRNSLYHNKSHDLLPSEARPATMANHAARVPAKAHMTDKRPRPVRDEKYFDTNKGCRSDSCPLTSSRPVHMWVPTVRAQQGITGPAAACGRTHPPLARVSALHGVSGCAGSHLGSTLNPGGAVAYIRAAASPSEVCSPIHAGTETMCPSNASSEFPHVGLITQKTRRFG
jgi:hypothetical protein